MLSTAAGLARAFAIVIRMVSDLMSMVTEEDSYATHAPSLACVLQVTASRDLPMLQSFLERRLGMDEIEYTDSIYGFQGTNHIYLL